MITVSNVSHAFQGIKEIDTHRVLHNINIHVRPGEFMTVFGPSGSGKSTLVSLIGGYLKIQEGSIRINGNICTSPGKNRVVVNQENDLYEWLTIEENLRLVSTEENLMDKYLSLVQLQKFRTYYPSALSGGMKKRASLIRALLVHPKILVLDEPFASLDSRMREELHLELDKIFAFTGTTTVLVTHDLDEAVFLSDRIILLGNNPTQIIGEFDIRYRHPRNLSFKQSKFFKDFLTKVKRKIQLSR